MALSYGQSYLAALGGKPKTTKTYIPGSYYQAPAPKVPVQALWGGSKITGGTPPTYNTTNSFNPAPAPVYNPAPVAQAPQATYSGGGESGGAAAAEQAAQAAAADEQRKTEEIWAQAGQFADNEINPQLTEIDNQLQQAGYSADESQRAINEAYPIARRSMQKSIYENMVAGEGSLAAMGTGRGGGRQELLARAGERTATGLEVIETAKTRETGAINRALDSYRGQLGTTKTSLVGQRGNLQARYAEQIRGNRFNEASTNANIQLNRDQLAQQATQFNANLAQNADQFGATLAENANQFNTQFAENTRRFNIGNTPSSGSGTGTGYAGPGGFNHKLTSNDLFDAGLGDKVNNAPVKATGGATLGYSAIQSGRPKKLKYTVNGLPYYGY